MMIREPNGAIIITVNVSVYRMSLVTDVIVAITITTVMILAMDVKLVIVLKLQIALNVTIIPDNVLANLVSPENCAIDACQGTGTTAKMDVNVSLFILFSEFLIK